MEEDMMMPNVAPAPMMAGTPMGGDLSEPMAPAQAELDPDEMQEAQGALMQIIQIIQMLINQGMSEEEIQQFLAQYGITEEELDQAAAILGVDIDALIAGEQRMPMAEGGDSTDKRTKQYNQRLAELEDFISRNRLVSKEAQMSRLSGEGYKDPRFNVSFDNPLINQFALYPLAAEGSGYQPTTQELGMSGVEAMLEPTVAGRYSPRTDVVMFKNPSKGLDVEALKAIGIKINPGDIKTAEDIQKHELIHRAAQKSGYLDFLPTSEFLKENATTKYLKGGIAKVLTPLINEVLAESYEDTDGLENRIRFRVSRFNINDDMKDIIADEMIENVDVLKQDFENYLATQVDPIVLKSSRGEFSKGGMTDPLAPARIPRTPDMMIFSINSDINNLMQEYNMAVRNNEFERAQAIADQIDGLQQQIINLQDSKVPPMAGLNMRFGGSATGK